MGRRNQRRARKLPIEPVLVSIRDLGHDGRGVGQIVDAEQEGKTVFVHGALPGERVSAKLIARNRQFDEAVVVEVLTPSEQRITPQCPWFGSCGGCALQHLAHPAQITWKHKRLVDNLERIGQVQPLEWAEPIEGEAWGYRRRARLSVRYVAGKERVLVGFREKQGRFVADVGHCEVLDRHFSHRLEGLSQLIGSLSIKASIPQLEIAAGDEGAAMIVRHLEPLSSEDLMALKHWSTEHDVAVYGQSKGPDTIQRLWPMAHQLRYRLEHHAVELDFSPEQFIQVNASVNAQLIDRALEWLDMGPSNRVLDLFCGLGNFSLALARRVGEVVGVEGAIDLVDRAKANAQRNGLDNVSFHVADLTLPVAAQPFAKQDFDGVLIDPPRSGAEEILPLIGASGARRVVYVSCNPATLAKDAGILVRDHGYRLMRAGIADMFPHTAHVESIALFEKGA